MDREEFNSNFNEEMYHWDCVNKTVRSTGEIVMVKNLNAFEPDRIPEWVQVAPDGTHLRYFKHYELE